MNTTEKHEVVVESFEAWTNVRKVGYYSTSSQRYIRTEAGSRPSDPSRVFLHFKGETILDNINNRTQRPSTTLKPLVKQALEAAGIPFTKIRWSQKAGCRMCPCSPGFIIENEEWEGKDYTLTVTDKTEYADREVTILL